jgi:1,4-dihydroxy-2-naphthoate octaprenyltransferase
MAEIRQWIEGARPRTLPVNVAPVIAGSGLAAFDSRFVVGKAVLCLIVAMALQVGVNYANDYSDGIRGTDAERVGPLRLVGSGVASAVAVRRAAFGAFEVAMLAGLVLAATSTWWLLAVGAAAIAAAWFYTGGPNPYGYRALGEVSVFVFFGLVAATGTAYVQIGHLTSAAVLVGVATGCFACAVLVANNLRDIPSDQRVGKRTLAVVVGEVRSRTLYRALVVLGYVALVGTAALTSWWAMLALLAAPLSARGLVVVGRGAVGAALVPVLRDTGLAELTASLALAVGLVVAR